MPQVPAILSVDLEFFQHSPAYRKAAGTTTTKALGRNGISILLDAYDTVDARGTFFIVSDIVDEHSELINNIVTAGHEIASHTHTHRHLSRLPESDQRAELINSKERLEDATGIPIEGFRAPSFDVPRNHFELLSEAGYTYDSSIVPCRTIPGWYGGEFKTRKPSPATVINKEAPPELTEVPIGIMPWLRLPLTGTWIRFFGVRYTLLGMKLLARRGIPPVLYVHPWELIDLPKIKGIPKRIYMRSGKYMRRAIKRILTSSFEFVTIRSLITKTQEYSASEKKTRPDIDQESNTKTKQ
jgi:peptidoglycan/xylan/chitin deacetylase (PgdA/CDA1 family)